MLTLTVADVPTHPVPCAVTRMRLASLVMKLAPKLSKVVWLQTRAVSGPPALPSNDQVIQATRGKFADGKLPVVQNAGRLSSVSAPVGSTLSENEFGEMTSPGRCMKIAIAPRVPASLGP